MVVSPGSVRVAWKGASRPPDKIGKKKAISEWSRKSRASMVRRLCSLDYSPLFADDDHAPAVITLTYPGDWLAVAPDGASAKSHVAALRKRYQREYGMPLRGVWKMEFQARGAVHFHIFCAPPTGAGFATWLSKAWADVVDAPDPTERAAHVGAGTRMDWAEGLRASDPRRVAVYFTKHGSANFGDKEYQNRPPAEWLTEGKVLGRFWGIGSMPSRSEWRSISTARSSLPGRSAAGRERCRALGARPCGGRTLGPARSIPATPAEECAGCAGTQAS